uniref:Peptidase aspartic putative domain-containing protein n=1 Tax=Trichogramma kaykai TaxID=54128 RepID=A0ABD2W636_9HYME
MPKLSGLLPKHQLKGVKWTHLEGLELADLVCDTPAAIDCIIGAELYPDYIRAGLRRGPAGSPIAYNTAFGWLITGPTDSPKIKQGVVKSFTLTINHTESLGDELCKFWELEELLSSPKLTPTEELCEKHFCSTFKRDTTGRYVVRLPFNNQPELPGSLAITKQRFWSLEHRLANNPALRQDYNRFMHEYETLGHMKRVSGSQLNQEGAYLPYHAVVTKKLRVVFNASQKASNGKALNDFLHVGAKLQVDIATILLR